MPYALSIDVPYDVFWHLNPRLLKPFVESYQRKMERKDELMWLMGMYVQDAVSVAVEHNLAGRKAKSKYIEKPMMQKHKEEQKQNILTEEEKMKQVEMFFAGLQIKKANFDLEKQGKLKGDK